MEPIHLIKDGDLLLSWSATLRANIWNGGEAALNQHIFRVDAIAGEVDTKYAQLALSALINTMRAQAHGSAMQHITKSKLIQIPIAIPPQAEQQRIVEKVDELMAVCDELGESLATERQLADDFAESAAHALVS